jgi:patatin-like phospholipase/acyl hydrolase
MSTYRILSLDGGGLRGLITAGLLERLAADERIGGWIKKTDLVAGTSTGGILALGLAHDLAPSEICELYRTKGHLIFADSVIDNIRDLGKFVGADYSSEGLRRELKRIFGRTTLAGLRMKVAIPTFDLDNGARISARTWKPKIFHNFAGDDSDGSESAAAVALYTSAAPTYFPSAGGYVDGGVFANNPAIVALAQAISQRNLPSERAAIDRVALLSVGTGVSLRFIEGEELDWGLIQWAKPIIEILMEGVAGIADYQAMQLLGERYHRVQPVLPHKEKIPLDAVDKIGRMDTIAAEFDLRTTVDWISRHWLESAQ